MNPGSIGKSLALHIATFLILVITYTVESPLNTVEIAPAVKVEIIDLPDATKSESNASEEENNESDEPEQNEPEVKAEKKVEPIAPPKQETPVKEVVQKPTPIKVPVKAIIKKETSTTALKSKMQNSLNRLKALSKISDSKAPAKGNMISEGEALSAATGQKTGQRYFGLILSKVRQNWALPAWLQRQNLQADAWISIDAYGGIRNIKIIHSSGNSEFDSAIKETILQSAPFPRPPESLEKQVQNGGVLLGFPL